LDEIGVDKATGITRVKIDEKYFRPAEVNSLMGDSSKARKLLNWKPKVSFEQLVEMMVKSDLENETKEDTKHQF